jgi:hypothetical protein
MTDFGGRCTKLWELAIVIAHMLSRPLRLDKAIKLTQSFAECAQSFTE